MLEIGENFKDVLLAVLAPIAVGFGAWLGLLLARSANNKHGTKNDR